MIYDIVFGKTTDEEQQWEILEVPAGKRSSFFYANDNIRQRLRIDLKDRKGIQPGVLTPVISYNGVKAYEMMDDFRWISNNINLNPVLAEKSENYRDKSELMIFVITVKLTNYKILGVHTNKRIMQTFHKRGEYQGCIVPVSKEEMKVEGTKIMTIDVFDVKSNTYKSLVVSFNSDTDEVSVKKYNIKDNEKLKDLQEKNEKMKFSMQFKIKVKAGDLITAAYFVKEDDIPLVSSAIKGIKNSFIFEVPNNFNELSDEDKMNYVNKPLFEEATSSIINKKARIRAVTTVDVVLPKEFINDSGILYLMTTKADMKYLRCYKSN